MKGVEYVSDWTREELLALLCNIHINVQNPEALTRDQAISTLQVIDKQLERTFTSDENT